jgi:hypothetical protein
MNAPAVAATILPEAEQEGLAIIVGFKNVLSPVPTRHHCAGVLES